MPENHTKIVQYKANGLQHQMINWHVCKFSRLEEFNWLRSVTTPPVDPQAPAQIEEKNGCWLDEIQWDWYL